MAAYESAIKALNESVSRQQGLWGPAWFAEQDRFTELMAKCTEAQATLAAFDSSRSAACFALAEPTAEVFPEAKGDRK